MRAKTELRRKALELRKQGLSYSEIRKIVPVAKSSLSKWLPKIHLKKSQTARLKAKLRIAQKIGSDAKRKQRIAKTKKIKEESISQIKNVLDKELFYMGIMLYWAEGTKEKDNGEGVSFTNSDPFMCRFFLKCLRTALKISEDRIIPRIYIHDSLREKGVAALKYWSSELGIPKEKFKKTCFTKTKFSSTKRRKDNGEYYGQLRIRIVKSTDLNRQISGWIKGICLQSGVIGENEI